MPDNAAAAVAQVASRTNPAWSRAVLDVVYELARTRAEFTTDDVWEALDAAPGVPHVHERRAMGAIMRSAQKSGWVAATDRFARSRRPVCHSKPVLVWRSTVRSGPFLPTVAPS